MSPARKQAALDIATAHTWALELLEETERRVLGLTAVKHTATLRNSLEDLNQWLGESIRRRKAGMAVIP